MMMDTPIAWHEGADKEGLLDYIFAHQRMRVANEAYASHYALPVSEIIGRTPNDFYTHDPVRGRRGWRAMLDAGYLHTETDERRGDGTPIRVEGHYLCLYDDEGRFTGHIGIQRDITERHAAAEEVTRSREELRVLAAHLHTVREQERTRIARELHDELGQALTGLKLDLSWLEQRLSRSSGATPLRECAHDMMAQMNAVMVAVRRIITELRPSILDELGLAAAIEWQAQDFGERTGIHVTTAVSDVDTAAPEPIASSVFRTLQEALTNVARHAQATCVTVSFVNEAGALILRVADDGRGMAPERNKGRQSLGLLGLRERAVACGGEIEVAGAPGTGTTLTLRVPLARAPA